MNSEIKNNIKNIFKKYNVTYNRNHGIIDIKNKILTCDFIYLKNNIHLLGLVVNDIRVGEGVYEKV